MRIRPYIYKALAGLMALAGPAVSACNCGGRGPSSFSGGVIVHPELVLPELEAPAVKPAVTLPPPLQQVELLAPVLRGPRQIDLFVQDEARVDVLWIVDNSASLSNERERLAIQFSQFLQVLLTADVDFHVGVTSTDLQSPNADDGRLRGSPRWIDRSTPDPEAVFAAAVDFPNDLQIRLEEGLAAMVRALTPPRIDRENRGFLRDDAGLAVIVVSDEDDGSIGDTGQYIRFLESVRGPGREVNVALSAVVGDQPDGCVVPGEERIFGARAEAGDRYVEVAAGTGGLVASICDADFGPFVESLAIALSGLRRFFPLSAPAARGSIIVIVAGRRIPESPQNGWVYLEDARGISFPGTFVPPPGAEVRIEYDVAL